jgi:hypothetical protein
MAQQAQSLLLLRLDLIYMHIIGVNVNRVQRAERCEIAFKPTADVHSVVLENGVKAQAQIVLMRVLNVAVNPLDFLRVIHPQFILTFDLT